MDQTEEEGWWRLIKRLATLKKEDEIKEFLTLFLTPEERHDLSLRYLIIQELLKGERTQREIAKDLGVSIAKITRGSNALKSIPKNLRRLLEE